MISFRVTNCRRRARSRGTWTDGLRQAEIRQLVWPIKYSVSKICANFLQKVHILKHFKNIEERELIIGGSNFLFYRSERY